MKICLLDAQTLGDDLSYKRWEELGELSLYPHSTVEEARERAKDAQILVSNKVPFTRETLSCAQNLQLICLTSTGVNTVDLEYVKSRGIGVCNVPAYSTDSVAQHTFAMLFHLMEQLDTYHRYTRKWASVSEDRYAPVSRSFFELRGKTWGIFGLGAIGHRVAELAQAFGCSVVYASASGVQRPEPYPQMELESLLEVSDILSIHAPLNPSTENRFTFRELSRMKSTAYLLNVGRGGIVNEKDLVKALQEHKLAGAAMDVFTQEPLPKEHPFLQFPAEDRRLLLTPHMAWAAKESRERLVQEVYENMRSFLQGGRRNRVV